MRHYYIFRIKDRRFFNGFSKLGNPRFTGTKAMAMKFPNVWSVCNWMAAYRINESFICA